MTRRGQIAGIAERLLFEREQERRAEERRIAAAIAAGPPTGSRVAAQAWSDWHRYGFHACPGEKRDLTCDRTECGVGAQCAKMAVKGLHGDGTPMLRRERPACGAKTRAGGECVMRVEPGKLRCRLHGGLSTGPNTKEGLRRLSDAMKARWTKSRGEHP